MTEIEHDLPKELVEWIAQVGHGEITHIHRHVARREAWVVDVTRKDGSVLNGFLRLQRGKDFDEDVDPRRLETGDQNYSSAGGYRCTCAQSLRLEC